MPQLINRYRYLPMILLGIGIFSLYNYLFYPGLQTSDTILMLSHAKGLDPISNWHPPFLVFIWGLIFKIFGTDAAIWWFQILFYIIACFCLVINFKSAKVSYCLFVALLLFSPIFNSMWAIWKDCWALIGAIFCAAIAIMAIKNNNLGAATGVAFIISSLLRYDYIIITFPILLTVGWQLYIANEYHLMKRIFNYILYITSFLVLTIAAHLAVNSFVAVKLNPWVNTVIWDAVGTDYFSRVKIEPKLDQYYNCATSDPLIFFDKPAYPSMTNEGIRVFTQNNEATYFRSLWWEKISSNPMAYLQHRLCVMKSYISLNTPTVNSPYPKYDDIHNYAFENRNTLFTKIYVEFHTNKDGKIYRYWYYIALSTVLILYNFLRRKITLTQIAIYLSLLGSFLRFMIIPATDFRYGLWMVAATVIIIALSFDNFSQKNNNETKV